MKLISILLMVFLPLSQAFAHPGLTDNRGNPSHPADIFKNIKPGTIFIIGEAHAQKNHAAQQIELMQGLKSLGMRVGVGMEFLSAPAQPYVDQFRAGQISEEDFLELADWKGADFKFYREQILFPGDARTIALNAPRSLTAKVARQGIASLTADEQKLLPPNFQLGRAEYFERFVEAAKDHVPTEEARQRYFEAQSIWDETMAYNALEALKADPNQVLVIVVGEFHIQYGGGLPDRLAARGAANIVTLSQTLDDDNILTDPKYGQRADWIWISKSEGDLKVQSTRPARKSRLDFSKFTLE